MLKILLVVLSLTTSSVYGQLIFHYELEFLDPGIYKPCTNYPDNFVDQIYDMSKLHIEQTGDGSIILKGTITIKMDVKPPQPVVVEIYKKVRGEWQQTQFTQRRFDFCTSCFDPKEFWHTYLRNTPKEQLKCPFYEGQSIDYDVEEPSFITMPTRSFEGEYNFHFEAGNKSGDFFICADVFAIAHKV